VLERDDEFFFGRALVGLGRELRITERCLTDDLSRGPDAVFEDLQSLDIIRAFVRERRDKDIGSPLTGLTTQVPVGVLRHGHDHRGATWFDEDHDVVWLMAYRLHRSGKPDDFFPWVQDLDAREELFPTEADYEQLERDRADRFTKAILIECPQILKAAREAPDTEIARELGGEYAIAVTVEVADDLEAITIAFDLRTLQVVEHMPAILAALAPDPEGWEVVGRMPKRALRDTEQAFQYTGRS
jgi:hypothetical protein